MKLHRDIGVTQKTAWFMLHRIREAWIDEKTELFSGPVEADETYMGGREKNKHKDRKLNADRGPVGKTPVVGVKDRDINKVKAQVVKHTNAATLQGFVIENTDESATVYDDVSRYSSPCKLDQRRRFSGRRRAKITRSLRRNILARACSSHWPKLEHPQSNPRSEGLGR